MSERLLKADTRMFFGEPANPMSATMVGTIGQVVAQVPGIREAYLPQCYIQGDSEARQVLVICVASRSQISNTMQTLMENLQLVLPAGNPLDVLPYTISSMPREARVDACLIFKAVDPPSS
jgi:hypothetical protein